MPANKKDPYPAHSIPPLDDRQVKATGSPLPFIEDSKRMLQGHGINVKFDGFVKSPYAALRCILRHCGVQIVRLIPQNLRALPMALFTKPSVFLTFYEFVKFGRQLFTL